MKSYERSIRPSHPVVKRLKELLRQLDINYRFYWRKYNVNCWGYADARNNRIHAYTRQVTSMRFDGEWYELLPITPLFGSKPMTVQEFVSTVCHEIYHIISVREKRFLAYNLGIRLPTTKLRFHRWASQALRAERYCDRQGRKLMRREFPGIPFIAHYSGAKGRRIVRALIDSAK